MDQHRALYGFDCGPWRLNRYLSVPSLVTAFSSQIVEIREFGSFCCLHIVEDWFILYTAFLGEIQLLDSG